MSKQVVLDSSIFVEAWTLQKYEEFCSEMIRKYMNNKNETCYIPIIIPGETIMAILENIKDKERITQILREYKNSFLSDNIVFLNINKEVLEIKSRLDYIWGIDDHDKIIIACAIANNCTEIITLDVHMYNQRSEINRLSRELKGHEINIIIPKKFERGILDRIKRFE